MAAVPPFPPLIFRSQIMNKIVKTITVSAVILGLGTTVAFARSNGAMRGSPCCQPAENFSEWNMGGRNFAKGKMMMPKADNGIKNADLLGTITSVDTEKQIVTVKDVDGKESQVHVNPFTKIREFDLTGLKAQADRNKKRKEGSETMRPEINETKLEDLKEGSWVAVNKFDTGTKILEASKIILAKD